MDVALSHLVNIGAGEAARRIVAGEITSEELVEACLKRIAEREEAVQAWHYLDADFAREQARRADQWRASGQGMGPLHGVPVGIKDIIDTAEMPTAYGSAYFEGRRSGRNAAVVQALKDAGAIILGKTATTELAVMHPAKTRNPHNEAHTPGGSSSGSAAAVADYMVPLALGTQTAGSVIRPAGFCGIFGFKPTFGLISRHGVLSQSPPLDTVGVFARGIEDLALAADCLTAFDPRDDDMWPRSRPRLLDTAMAEPPVKPAFAFVKGPAWDEAEPATVEAFVELKAALGEQCDELELPAAFAQGLKWQRMLQQADIAKNYGGWLEQAPEVFSDTLKSMAEDGRKVLATDYNTARDYQEALYTGLTQIFERYNAILTPAAPGPAPHGLETTGSPAFCGLWTYMGVPAVTVPLLEADGLPMGVQLIGPRRDDARLLRTARWLTERLSDQ